MTQCLHFPGSDLARDGYVFRSRCAYCNERIFASFQGMTGVVVARLGWWLDEYTIEEDPV